ncbi:MAG: ABC transporter permease [Candidatus Acidiferrales bacterium]
MSSRKSLHILAGSLRSIWRFPLRSGLLLLSAMLGVAGVTSAINYAAEGRLKALAQIRRMGINILVVTPQQSRVVGGRARTGTIVTTLVEEDYAAIQRELPDIAQSSATTTGSFLVKAGDLSKNSCPVIGVEPDYFPIRNWIAVDGIIFGSADTRRSSRVVLLGWTVARDLFGDASPVGRRVLINRVPFEVTGVLAGRGQSLDAGNEDNQVYIPLTTAMHRLMNVSYYSSLIFEIANWDRMDEDAQTIRETLSRRHHVLANLPVDFQIQNQKSLIDTETLTAEKLAFLVRWVGLSGLFVSGLGILAITWIAVRERIGEIGTRRAVGATASDILFQFLFEAAIVSLIGCLVGLAAGWEGSRIVAQRAGLPFYFDWRAARLVILLSAGLNLAFALFPSGKAALLHPVRALKYD